MCAIGARVILAMQGDVRRRRRARRAREIRVMVVKLRILVVKVLRKLVVIWERLVYLLRDARNKRLVFHPQSGTAHSQLPRYRNERKEAQNNGQRTCGDWL